MRIILLIMIFFICGGLLVIENHNLALYSSDNASRFGGIYFNWIGHIISNSETITGDVVDLKWLPTNSTNSNISK